MDMKNTQEQQRREWWIHRYVQAFDRGDAAGLEAVLDAALSDPELSAAIDEIAQFIAICSSVKRWVAYLLAADNFIGPLLSRLRGTQQPVVRPRHAFSAPRSHLLAHL